METLKRQLQDSELEKKDLKDNCDKLSALLRQAQLVNIISLN